MRIRAFVFLLVVFSLSLSVACGKPAPTPTPTPIPPTPTRVPPTPTATPTATPTPAATPTPFPRVLFLQIDAPQDETVVNTAQMQVKGGTLPDAVVSVNGNIVSLDERGRFATTVTLVEGPNVIGVIASDLSGNQMARSLAVIYVP